MEKDKEFRICTVCGYKRGFHVYFRDVEEKGKGYTRIGLICPNCGQSYDLNWITTDIKEIKIEKQKSY